MNDTMVVVAWAVSLVLAAIAIIVAGMIVLSLVRFLVESYRQQGPQGRQKGGPRRLPPGDNIWNFETRKTTKRR